MCIWVKIDHMPCVATHTSNLLMKRLTEILKRLVPSRPVSYLIIITLVGAVVFSIIRLVLFLQNKELLAAGIDNNYYWVMRAMIVGFRFDLNLTFMLMLPAALALAIGEFAGQYARWTARIATWWLAISYSATLIACTWNIPYFTHFQAHINAMSMQYATTGFADNISMILNEPIYLFFAISAIVIAIIYALFIVWLSRRFKIATPTTNHTRTLIALIALSLLFLWADRGFYFRYRTLEPRDAVISNNAFINKLGINPVEPFVMSLSTVSNTILLMPHDQAHDVAIEEMHRDASFLTHVDAKSSPWRNVVIILEESFTAERLTREGSTEILMPNLERMIQEGLYFENTYSAGTHTCNAIYALVTSYPSFVDKHPMQDCVVRPLHTIIDQVYSRGDITPLFYVTHGPNYDNLRNFITTQGFERLMSRNNYGVETDKMWGVDDHIMFDVALKEIDQEWHKGNAVAAVLLTCSNHSPYDPPLNVGFTPTTTDIEHQAIEYADWALNRFMEMAKEMEWYDETLFIITGDHGRAITLDYVIPESLNHVPLLFYSPKHIAPEVRSDLVAQMDIMPTAISMLGLAYDNHTMGIDLMSESRRMIPFGHDGHIAARDHDWLYIYDVHNDMPYLYNISAEGNERMKNVASEHPERVEEMHIYSAAMIQAGWDIHNAHNVWGTFPTE